MLGTKAAAHLNRQRVHQRIALLPHVEKRLLIHVRRLTQVVMQIAIAQVTEGHWPNARQQLLYGGIGGQ